MSLDVADIIIFTIIIASALMALLRGFVREVLTIIAWLGAAIAAIYLFPYVQPTARGFLNPPILADIAAFTVVFVVVLIPAFLFTSQLGWRFGRDNPGVLDRTGGFLFGVARGLFVVGLAYWVHSIILEPGTVPFWAKDSRLKGVIQTVAGMFPQNIDSIAAPASSGGNDAQADDDSGYAQSERRGLDQLITTTTED